MDERCESPEIIQHSQVPDGQRAGNWRGIRFFSAVKACELCGALFRPHALEAESRWKVRTRCPGCAKIKIGSWRQRASSSQKMCVVCGEMFSAMTAGGAIVSEKAWAQQKCCSISCAKKLSNPMHSDASRQKQRATFKRIGHAPSVRGGNGRPMTKPQEAMLAILGEEWKAEFAVTTGMPRGYGIPGSYKLDLAKPSEKLGVELNGGSHNSPRARELDAKKDRFLATLGWKVYRLKNADALMMCSTCTSADTLLILLKGS